MSETIDIVPDAPKPATDIFPKAKIEKRLTAALIEAAKVEADIREIDVPATPAGQRMMEITIDSLVVVELLITIEPILGFEFKGTIVREGGYNSVDKALKHLLPRIEKEWRKGPEKRHA